MVIDITSDNRTKHDTYLLYEKIDDVESFIDHKITPVGRFKAEDHIDYTTSSEEHNGVSHRDAHKLTIKTYAQLDFSNNECVYDVKYGITWRIESFTISDDGQMKEFSLRPRKQTYLNLVR